MSDGYCRIAASAIRTPAAEVSTAMLGIPRFSTRAATSGRAGR